MAAGEVNLQANDLRVATVTFEDGAVGNVSVVVPKEGGTLASEAYVASEIGAIPTIADATSSVKGIDYKRLLAEYVVTGSARTSIDFSGLDINSHKSYNIEIELLNTSGTAINLYCFINGDTVLTNYYTQLSGAISTAYNNARTNNPSIGDCAGSSRSMMVGTLTKTLGYPAYCGITQNPLGASIGNYVDTFSKTATVTNITQLTFTSSIANSIGIGSKIRIYRGDV